MSQSVIFLEFGRPQPSELYEAFFATTSHRCLRLTSQEDLLDLEMGDKTAFVLAFGACQAPHHVIEIIKQKPNFCRYPLFVVEAAAEPENDAFCQEYSLDYRVQQSPDPALTVAALTTMMSEDAASETPRALRDFWLRHFYHKLHSGDLAGAEEIVQSWDATSDRSERIFLQGLVLKTCKDFEAAFKVLGQVLLDAQDKARMDAKFLHLLGDVSFKRKQAAQARTFLEAAHKRSPRNLRRLFLLGQLYLDQQETTLAIGAYRSIYEAAPAYSGIHVRLAELLYTRATTPAQVDTLAKLFPHISEIRLIGLYKKAHLNSHAAVLDRLLTLIAQELLRHSEGLASQDDFYGALNLVTRAGMMLPKSADSAIRQEIMCRGGELHIAAGDVVKAAEAVASLADLGLEGEMVNNLKRKLATAQLKAKG